MGGQCVCDEVDVGEAVEREPRLGRQGPRQTPQHASDKADGRDRYNSVAGQGAHPPVLGRRLAWLLIEELTLAPAVELHPDLRTPAGHGPERRLAGQRSDDWDTHALETVVRRR